MKVSNEKCHHLFGRLLSDLSCCTKEVVQSQITLQIVLQIKGSDCSDGPGLQISLRVVQWTIELSLQFCLSVQDLLREFLGDHFWVCMFYDLYVAQEMYLISLLSALITFKLGFNKIIFSIPEKGVTNLVSRSFQTICCVVRPGDDSWRAYQGASEKYSSYSDTPACPASVGGWSMLQNPTCGTFI